MRPTMLPPSQTAKLSQTAVVVAAAARCFCQSVTYAAGEALITIAIRLRSDYDTTIP